MSAIEFVAAGCGFLAVWLTIARNKWCWPLGLMQVALYVLVFWRAKLYSDMLLHAIYVALQVYGWCQWTKQTAIAADTGGRVIVKHLPVRILAGCVALTVAGSAGLGFAMQRLTDASFPYGDAFTTVASLVAQILLARRFLENWSFWIAVDVVAIAIYWQKDLVPTVVLYSLFLLMSIFGLWKWRQSMSRQRGRNHCDICDHSHHAPP